MAWGSLGSRRSHRVKRLPGSLTSSGGEVGVVGGHWGTHPQWSQKGMEQEQRASSHCWWASVLARTKGLKLRNSNNQARGQGHSILGPCCQSNLFYLYLFLRDNKCTTNKIQNAKKVYGANEVFLLPCPLAPSPPHRRKPLLAISRDPSGDLPNNRSDVQIYPILFNSDPIIYHPMHVS